MSTEAAADPALDVHGLRSGYGATTVIRDVSLTVAAGSVAALIGPNGAGKTTLLKTISGIVRPSRGTIHMGGTDVTTLSPARRHRIGACTIPEGRGIFRSLTVRENLKLQVGRGQEREAVDRAVAAFPRLGERLGLAAGVLSGGEQQMLAMAQAYVVRPRLVLIDEASLGLAPQVVDVIFEFLENVSKDGASLLIVDQFAHRVLEMADTGFVLRRGELVYAGAASELLASDIFQEYLTGSGNTTTAPGSNGSIRPEPDGARGGNGATPRK